MPASNSVMIHKLQNAMNEKFDARILYNKRQWYSDDQNRPVTTYVISKAVWDDNKSRYNNIELFKSCSQIQIVLYLRDYWYELNGWEVPHDNPMWEKAKEKYQEKQQPNDIEPVMKGKKKGVKDLEKRFDNEKEAKAWIKSQKKTDKEASKIRLVSKEEMDEKIKQAQIKENKKQADTRNGKNNYSNNYSNKSLSQLQEIKKNLEAGAKITGTSEGTARQLAEINKAIQSKEKTSKPVSLVSKSSGSLKTMYKNASTEEERKRIGAELNSRGFYSKNGKWTSKGGGR